MTDRELLELILKNQSSMQDDIKELKKTLDTVYQKVGENTEQLEKISNSLDFLKARQMDVEEQLFHLKKKVS